VPARDRPNKPLHELRDIVAALYVSPLVDHDPIEVGISQALQQYWRDGDDGRSDSEHRSGSDLG
jgi:hypothetical protein